MDRLVVTAFGTLAFWILAAFRHAKQRGIRFEALAYERNQTGLHL